MMELPFAVPDNDPTTAAASHSYSSTTTARTTNTTLRAAAAAAGGSGGGYDNNDDDDLAEGEETTIDFAYINVGDDKEVDIWLDGSSISTDRHHHHHHGRDYNELRNHDGKYNDPNHNNNEEQQQRPDILAFLLQEQTNPSHNQFLALTEQGHRARTAAVEAKRKSEPLQVVLDCHTEAAHCFHQAAILVQSSQQHGGDAGLAKALLLLSQTQAYAARAVQRIINLPPAVRRVTALYRQPEADLSASTFLGTAAHHQPHHPQQRSSSSSAGLAAAEQQQHGPVVPSSSQPAGGPPVTGAPNNNAIDEMMELERELRSMDMKLDLNNSIASLDARNRMKSSMMGDSFMVVPPVVSGGGLASSSYLMGSSAAAALPPPPRHHRSQQQQRGHNGRGVTTTTTSSATTAQQQQQQHRPAAVAAAQTIIKTNMEGSWWGNASQILAPQSQQAQQQQQSSSSPQANTKQIMRLMESFRTLGNENAALLKRLEQAESARAEAAAAKKEMRKFKEEFSEKFVRLKNQLSEIRRDYPTAPAVLSSQYLRPSASAAATEQQLQRQEQLIRKLTADLKKEKQDNKEKDAVLQKYEVFYKQVKARSAEKKKQQQQQQKSGSSGGS